jgi:hypothetical protein
MSPGAAHADVYGTCSNSTLELIGEDNLVAQMRANHTRAADLRLPNRRVCIKAGCLHVQVCTA